MKAHPNLPQANPRISACRQGIGLIVAVAALAWMPAMAAEAAASAAPAAPRHYPPDALPVRSYTLPDLLVGLDGRQVRTADDWRTSRRPEVLELFRTHVYGRVPATPYQQSFKVTQIDPRSLGGTATRKVVEITITARGKSLVIPLVLYTPNQAKGPSPAFLLLGNASVNNYDPVQSRTNGYWPVEYGIERGYAMAAFWSWDVDPDQKTDTAFQDGIHALLDSAPRRSDAWATIAAWAWGMSRCLDYLVSDPAIAADQVAVVGHSRAGKTALWAAAQDERFAMACSNDSGCGGAALTRRSTKDKETVALINKHFPHWFAENFKAYNGRHDALPVDQHMLIALVAPRSVCVASADQDPWADPRGEFLSVVHAAPVYRLYGLAAIGDDREMPPIEQPRHGVGAHYWIRAGKHGLTRSDWTFYLDSADRAFGRTPAKTTNP